MSEVRKRRRSLSEGKLETENTDQLNSYMTEYSRLHMCFGS